MHKNAQRWDLENKVHGMYMVFMLVLLSHTIGRLCRFLMTK